MYADVHVCACVWRSESSLRCFLSIFHFFLRQGHMLTWSLTQETRLAVTEPQGAAHLHLPSHCHWDYSTIAPCFLCGLWESKSHALANALLTELSL